MDGDLIGKLRVETIRGEARILSGDLSLTQIEIEPRGVVVGRGPAADVRLGGPETHTVGRRHLLARPENARWVVVDISSTGTWEAAGDRASWRRLAPNRSLPLAPQTDLCLGERTLLRLTPLAAAIPAGTTTAPHAGGSPPAAARVLDSALEEVALEVLAHRRAGAERAAPSAEAVADALYVDRSTVYRSVARLRALPEIDRLDPDRGNRALADALAAAFPYLLALDPD